MINSKISVTGHVTSYKNGVYKFKPDCDEISSFEVNLREDDATCNILDSALKDKRLVTLTVTSTISAKLADKG